MKIDIDATTVNGWAMISRPHPQVGDTFEYESKHKSFSRSSKSGPESAGFCASKTSL